MHSLSDLCFQQADGDLSFNAGDRIELIEKTQSAEDWWTGRLNGVKGVFPGKFLLPFQCIWAYELERKLCTRIIFYVLAIFGYDSIANGNHCI